MIALAGMSVYINRQELSRIIADHQRSADQSTTFVDRMSKPVGYKNQFNSPIALCPIVVYRLT